MQTLHHLPMHLVLAELLHARGVTESKIRARFTIEILSGLEKTVSLAPLPDGAAVEWLVAGPSGEVAPLAAQRNSENFWFTVIEPLGLVYLQFNTVYDAEDETIRQFAERLSAALEKHPETTLVIDLRRNRGGDQSLALPLLHAVIASPQNRAGRLFTIIGRATFSAAMSFALEFEKHTQTLFVGEPTAARPNHYGDARKTLLSNSNVTLRISSRYWQWHPTDERSFIEPHLEAPPTRQAALAGVDPAVEEIHSITGSRGQVEIVGEWRGNLPPARYGRDSVMRVTGAAGSIAATVDIPAFGLECVPVKDLDVDDRRVVTFAIPVGEETLRYQGMPAGSWLVGHGELGSIRFPFLLKRAADSL